MKEIKFSNTLFCNYKVTRTDLGEGMTSFCTIFYKGTKSVTHRKYWLFGPKITREVPVILDEVDYTIESIEISKEGLAARLSFIKNKLQRLIELENGVLI